MATADPKKKKKKRRKKESLEHKRSRILVALAIFVAVYAMDELGVLERAFWKPRGRLRKLHALPRAICHRRP